MICNGCGNEHNVLRGAIIEGTFGQFCGACIARVTRMASPGHAAYSRAADRADHAADLIQPWDVKGRPSRDFITNYPDEAKDMFTPEELAEYG
jgi:hypothetical protein